MDRRYVEFCGVDRTYYDRRTGPDDVDGTLRAAAPLPDGWRERVDGLWRTLGPDGLTLPPQGWKVHVSPTMDRCPDVLATVHTYCTRNRLSYKHLRSMRVVLQTNSKQADRAGSGKFVTVYPPDDGAFERVVTDLDALLTGTPGPYVLNDLRIGTGPVYVRWGGFADRRVDRDGETVPAVSDPDGRLVPDVREPRFGLPSWVTLPAFLEPHRAARAGGDPGGLAAYDVTGALQFSNGGGVYTATRRSDRVAVVLKEARPHAGLAADGADAVARLEREFGTLSRLADVPAVPAVHERFTAAEHEFVAMERVAGIPLQSWMVAHHPLTRRDATEQDVMAYTIRAVAVHARVAAAVADLHALGVAVGDLHPSNVLVDDEDQVRIVDLEFCCALGDTVEPVVGAPGFRVPTARTADAADRFVLAVLSLWLFLPVTDMLECSWAAVPAWIAYVRGRFGVPDGFLDAAAAELDPGPAPPGTWPSVRPAPADWARLRDGMAAEILAAATPDRTDRLFPGDIRTFDVGGAGLAVGAAGVLGALRAAGAPARPDLERWLLDAAPHVHDLGYGDGACGIALVLDALGHAGAADRLLDRTVAGIDTVPGHDIASGLAGIGLCMLRLAGSRRDAALLDHARHAADRLAALLDRAEPRTDPALPGRAGIAHGWSGAALLYARLHRITGEPGLLDRADEALGLDLAECTSTPDGTTQVRDRRRTLPYLAVGSAGIAVAALQTADLLPRADRALPGLLAACEAELTVQSCLGLGRAGLLLTAALAAEHGRLPAAEVDRQVAALGRHAVPRPLGVGFPGHHLVRLSTDLDTGSAGVLLALHAAVHGSTAAATVLPYLPDPGSVSLADRPGHHAEGGESWKPFSSCRPCPPRTPSRTTRSSRAPVPRSP